MPWKIEFDPTAAKELHKLDAVIIKRILRFLYQHVATLEDPRSIGEALKGSRLGEFWKYRWATIALSRESRMPSFSSLSLR